MITLTPRIEAIVAQQQSQPPSFGWTVKITADDRYVHYFGFKVTERRYQPHDGPRVPTTEDIRFAVSDLIELTEVGPVSLGLALAALTAPTANPGEPHAWWWSIEFHRH